MCLVPRLARACARGAGCEATGTADSAWAARRVLVAGADAVAEGSGVRGRSAVPPVNAAHASTQTGAISPRRDDKFETYPGRHAELRSTRRWTCLEHFDAPPMPRARPVGKCSCRPNVIRRSSLPQGRVCSRSRGEFFHVADRRKPPWLGLATAAGGRGARSACWRGMLETSRPGLECPPIPHPRRLDVRFRPSMSYVPPGPDAPLAYA